MARCKQAEINNAPAEGDVITIKHYGYWRSGKLKFPFVHRVRNDVSWHEIVVQYKSQRIANKQT